MNFLEILGQAAARGVQVTVITNDHPPVALRLRWAQTITSMDARLRFRAAGYDLFVQDCDGDFSNWSVKRHGQLIAHGEKGYERDALYHCDAACLAAEEALFKDVRDRVAAIKGAAR